MRVFICIICAFMLSYSYGMRTIKQNYGSFRQRMSYEKVGCIAKEDRRIIFDKYREVRLKYLNLRPSDYEHSDDIEYIGYAIDEQCSDVVDTICKRYNGFMHTWFSRYFLYCLLDEGFYGIGLTPNEKFEEHVARCMSIPYVRESVTGLAVEALVKRLELACQPATDKTKRKKRNKATAEQTPDFSVLEAFRKDDFQHVINMNNEWLAHHDDPEYDHGAPMYWFPDLDKALESTIQDVKQQLINIAMMYNYPEQQRNAWDILYTLREYISPPPK